MKVSGYGRELFGGFRQMVGAAEAGASICFEAPTGGPAPAETGRAIEQSQRLLQDDRAWLTGRRAARQA